MEHSFARRLFASAVSVLLLVHAVHAEPQSAVVTPPDLAPWVEWVRARHPEWQCAQSSLGYRCVWPGFAGYQISASGAEFELHVELLQKDRVALPALNDIYPHDLKVLSGDRKREFAPRLEQRDGELKLALDKGSYVITGRFSWDKVPPEIPLPADYALLKVITDPELGAVSARRGEKSIWLEKTETEQGIQSFTLQVFRKVSDGSPLRITTLLRLKVSGKARSVELGPVTPESALPIKVRSPLVYHITEAGSLSLQLVPGEHEITVESVTAQPVGMVQLPKPASERWPAEETWSWYPDTAFRSVKIEGAQSLHAGVTQLPDEWKSGAVYQVPSGSKLTLNTDRRGEESPQLNELYLDRTLWIDLAGGGLTVQDRFSGLMNRDFRLNALNETRVGRATVDGQPALITKDTESGASGVEVRKQQLNVETVSRLTGQGRFSAVGWDAKIDRLSGRLWLPPSWRLIHILGAENVRTGWLESWSLMDIFISLLLTIAACKLLGSTIGALLAVSLVLNHGEFLAPRLFFIHLVLCAVWVRTVHDRDSWWGSASRLALAVTYAAWAVQCLAFAKLQVTQLLFPQLQAGTRWRTVIQEIFAGLNESIFAWPVMLAVLTFFYVALRAVVRAGSFGKAVLKAVQFGALFVLLCIGFFTVAHSFRSITHAPQARQLPAAPAELEFSDQSAPEAGSYAMRSKSGLYESNLDFYGKISGGVVNAAANRSLSSGPAVPNWRWRMHTFSVSGPVTPERRLRLIALSPPVTRTLSGARVIITLTLLALIFVRLGYSLGRFRISAAFGRLALVMLVLLAAPRAAGAQGPTSELLKELESRLAAERCQAKQCGTIERLDVRLEERSFRLVLHVASDGPSAVTVPGPLDVLAPTTVKVDGTPTSALRRSPAGFCEVMTPGGRSVVEVEGSLDRAESFSVQFEQRPLYTAVDAPSWAVEGLQPTGSFDDALRFIRRDSGAVAQGMPVGPGLQSELPAWALVRRRISIAESTYAMTEVERIGDSAQAAHLRIPLLEGERVTSGNIKVADGSVTVSIPAHSSKVEYTSALPYGDTLALTARPERFVSEEWLISCAEFLSCSYAGIKPTHTVTDGASKVLYLPFPGETVSVHYRQLDALPGESLTIDSMNHIVEWGANQQKGVLNLSLRATQQVRLAFELPDGAALAKAALNGQESAAVQNGRKVDVLVNPGSHALVVGYERSWSAGLFERVPEVKLSATPHNVMTIVNPSADRWLLWTGGGIWGPSVVLWAKLLFVVAICLCLVRFGILPLSNLSAAMLGIGLGTVPVIAIGFPLFWLGSLVLVPVFEDRLKAVPRLVRVSVFAAVTLAGLSVLYQVVETGLVLQPPMLIAGNGSDPMNLRWYLDHGSQLLPTPWVISLPLWSWRAFALVWSTWLVVALLNWLGRTLRVLSALNTDTTPTA